MTPQDEAPPPLPCGEGVGGEGRSAAAQPNQRTEKRGHGWAPAFGEDRQKDRARTKLRAARQRKEMTPSEKELWTLLRSIDGTTFRRQPAVGDYTFYFGCYAARLLIEIDGSIHEREDVQENDRAKTIYVATQNLRLLRFHNNDVWDRPAWVVARVRDALNAGVTDRPPPLAPPRKGAGDE
jgi:very-short-patch-repair endonuclease